MPTISQLPDASVVNTGDLFVIVQAGTTKQAADSLVLAQIQSTIQISESQVTGLTTSLAACLQKSNNLNDLSNVTTARTNLGLGPLTNGQLAIGSSGNAPVLANITAGSGISIANGAGSITISGSGSGIGWTNVTTATQQMTADSGYIADCSSSEVTFTLPTTSSIGQALSIIGQSPDGWTLVFNSGQKVIIGSVAATTTSGYVSSTNQYDSIDLICTVANTTWTTHGGVQGDLTIV